MSKFQFSDPTDALAGPSYRQGTEQPSGITLYFKHIPSGEICEFKAFITDYDDGFSSEWNKEEVFGRMDDIQIFNRTTRVINISWTVPSHSQEEALSNFNEISKMNSFAYPVYEDLQAGPQGGNFNETPELFLEVENIRQNLVFLNVEDESQKEALQDALGQIQDKILASSKQESSVKTVIQQPVSLISSPPIIQMKFMNWASDSNNEGLFGTISDYKFKPNLEEGVFIHNDLLIPMSCECSVSFTVIHTDKLGWDPYGNKRTSTFPYQSNKIIKNI